VLSQVNLRSGARVAAKPARGAVKVSAAMQQNWLPGNARPAHLDGKLAGDFGFDPLNLGANPAALRWYVQAELVHGRTAMAAVAGILLPGLLTKAGALNVPEWYDATDAALAPGGPAAFANLPALFTVQLLLSGFVETKRYMDFKKPRSQGEAGSFVGFETGFAGTGENGYPGGVFDPMGMAKEGGAKLEDLKLKEIKNGRLAMVAMLGFLAQHAATGKGPIDNLADHLSDPWHISFATNGVSLPFAK